MELKDFISQALSQIVDGVKEAQEKASEQGAYINPTNIKDRDTSSRHIFINDKSIDVNNIDFEVEVSTMDGNSKSGKAGIFVADIISVGAKNENQNTTMARNKLSFVVPVALPTISYNEGNTPFQPIICKNTSRKY
jgi:hypothetical protein